MTNSLQNLPPEMQERINQLVAGAKAAQAPAPITRPPSLMDHTIALRQEVAQLSNQVVAMGQVMEGVGQLVGELYQLFQTQTATTDYSSTYQENQELESDY
jgi:hypothetical protein|tara:strand:- start:221 stop:523 length:303 start_codon:yes stop_codon:yes gene_type:complete